MCVSSKSSKSITKTHQCERDRDTIRFQNVEHAAETVKQHGRRERVRFEHHFHEKEEVLLEKQGDFVVYLWGELKRETSHIRDHTQNLHAHADRFLVPHAGLRYGEEKADSTLGIHRFAVLFYEKIESNRATCGGEAEENAADEIGEVVRASAMDVHVFDARQQVIAEDEVDAGGYA